MARLKPIDGADVYLWKYLPSIPAAILFLVLFAALTSAHCWRMVKMRAWFCSTFAVGGLCTLRSRLVLPSPGSRSGKEGLTYLEPCIYSC